MPIGGFRHEGGKPPTLTLARDKDWRCAAEMLPPRRLQRVSLPKTTHLRHFLCLLLLSGTLYHLCPIPHLYLLPKRLQRSVTILQHHLLCLATSSMKMTGSLPPPLRIFPRPGYHTLARILLARMMTMKSPRRAYRPTSGSQNYIKRSRTGSPP